MLLEIFDLGNFDINYQDGSGLLRKADPRSYGPGWGTARVAVRPYHAAGEILGYGQRDKYARKIVADLESISEGQSCHVKGAYAGVLTSGNCPPALPSFCSLGLRIGLQDFDIVGVWDLMIPDAKLISLLCTILSKLDVTVKAGRSPHT
jgi:hypothetical protein